MCVGVSVCCNLGKEGADFLKSQGHDAPVADADVKTRGQKRELDDITTESPPKLARATTMAATAEVSRAKIDVPSCWFCFTLFRRACLRTYFGAFNQPRGVRLECATLMTRALFQEGVALVGDKERGKTRGQTEADEGGKSTSPSLKRTKTVEATAQVFGDFSRLRYLKID